MDIAHLYPPTPTDVPPAITRLDSAYRWRVVAMIGGLFAFLLIYLIIILLAGLAGLAFLLFPLPNVGGRGTLFILVVKVGGTLACALLTLFLVEGLFKNRRVERLQHISLAESDYPELFSFIRNVYRDVGARPPRKVYASPEVNAALIYETSLINLVIPPRKDLLIGLGLVNVLNLSEFKAVLAHEFGHFAQKSVGFGSYLYVANRVMHDVIYGRDALDRFVDQWCAVDLRISFPAWGLKGVLWVVRKMLAGIYNALNLLHLSLGRQMEFNADNVAVSVAGSDALIRGLSRSEFANECLIDAANSLNTAADHGLFTNDFYFHQNRSGERLRRLRKDDRLGLPPESSDGSVTVFAPANDGIPDKYRSHPTDHMREQNAKRIYVPGPRDDRSPWLLFGDPGQLKREVAAAFYRHALGRKEPYTPRPASAVQEFIDAEHAETTYDPKYHGWYDDRFIEPGDLDLLPPEPWNNERLDGWFANWPAGDLEQKCLKYRERQAEYGLLEALKSGRYTLSGKSFTFRERDCTADEVPRLLKQVDRELEENNKEFHSLDREVLLAHWSIARRVDDIDVARPREFELLKRYRFHTMLQTLLKGLSGEYNRLQAIMHFISGNPQMHPDTFAQVRDGLEEVRTTIVNNLEDAKRFETPALSNVPEGSSLYEMIVDRGDTRIGQVPQDTISGEWLVKLLNRMEAVVSRVRRLHYKSLGAILILQERIVAEWRAGPKQTIEADRVVE